MKTIKIVGPWLLVCSVLLLGVLAGCAKKEPAESAAPETVAESPGETETPSVAPSTEALEGLTFALEEVAVADIPDPKPSMLTRGEIENVLLGKVTIGSQELTAYVRDQPARQGQSSPGKWLFL